MKSCLNLNTCSCSAVCLPQAERIWLHDIFSSGVLLSENPIHGLGSLIPLSCFCGRLAVVQKHRYVQNYWHRNHEIQIILFFGMGGNMARRFL